MVAVSATRFSRRRLFRFLNPPADSEDVTVRVPHVHLPGIPRHVGGRPGDVKTLLETALVDGVDVVHPDRHPHALVGGIVPFRPERPLESAPAPAALGVLAQEDLALARAHAPEVGRRAPLPRLPPPPAPP